MRNYRNFLNEEYTPILKYYAFDWDDNILYMPTKIYMLKKSTKEYIPVSTDEFAKLRNNSDYDIGKKSFINFRDIKPNIFLEDTKKAISEKKFGPSWDTFIKALTSGSLFAIITARGHEPKTIRKAVKYIIDNVLTDEQRNDMATNLTVFLNLFNKKDIMIQYDFSYLTKIYLNNCMFIGVSSQYFMKKYPEIAGEFSVANPEKAKMLALQDFIDKINRFSKKIKATVKLGFSDDDKKNADKIEKFFNEINMNYNIEFNVYNTNNPDNIIKKKI